MQRVTTGTEPSRDADGGVSHPVRRPPGYCSLTGTSLCHDSVTYFVPQPIAV
jgi:hypothetical protein